MCLLVFVLKEVIPSGIYFILTFRGGITAKVLLQNLGTEILWVF